MVVEGREVRWSEPAETDLWTIVEFIARDRPLVAEETLRKIRTRAQSLRFAPERGRRVPEFERLGLRDYRELIISAWRLFYKVHRDRVEVLGVFDSRRNLEDLLLLRLARQSES